MAVSEQWSCQLCVPKELSYIAYAHLFETNTFGVRYKESQRKHVKFLKLSDATRVNDIELFRLSQNYLLAINRTPVAVGVCTKLSHRS